MDRVGLQQGGGAHLLVEEEEAPQSQEEPHRVTLPHVVHRSFSTTIKLMINIGFIPLGGILL